MASRPGIETARLAATGEAVGEERLEGEATYRVRPGAPDSEARWNPFASEQSRGFRVRAARTEAQRRVRIRDAGSAEAQRRRATHYEVLGVDPSATNREIERAYRALVVRYHPDRVQQDEAARVEAERVMRRLNAAMAVLRDPEKRARYDRAHLT